VVGLDVTPEMLAVAHAAGHPTVLVLADAGGLPFAARAVDAVLAAGLLTHLVDPAATLRDLARVVRPGGRLAVFHPVGRAALAARHGHGLHPDDLLDRRVLPGVLDAAGWDLDVLDDGADRYFARASAR
jgi:SAM-dependent methyltransferase